MVLRGEERDVILGDLDEEYQTDILPSQGRAAAARWYWGQVISSLASRSHRAMSVIATRRNFLGGVGQDLRYAARTLRKNPRFTVTAVATLALGIGANTAIFSVVDAVMFRPLPYEQPDRLVLLWNRSANTGALRMPISAPDVADFREQAALFEGFAFTDRIHEAALTGDGNPEHITLANVTANLFSLLGVQPVAGRGFLPNEGFVPPEVRNDSSVSISPNAVILSYGLWQRKFGGSADVIGRVIEINGQATRVVGVLPAEFELLLPPDAGMARRIDAWSPLRIGLSEFRRPTRLRDRDSDNTGAVIGRLRPGVTLAQVQAEMDAIAARQREQYEYHRAAGISVDVRFMHDDVVRHARTVLLSLFGAVGLLLLIACLNVANLLLAQTSGRKNEMRLRAALGASRARLIRQMLTESGLLAVLGGAGGLLLARWGIGALVALGPDTLPRAGTVGMDGGVMIFTLVTTVLAAFVFGVAPAFDSSMRNERKLLQSRGAGSVERARLRATLVVSEVALSLILLVGAGLLFKSFVRLQQVEPGFQPEGVLAFDVTLRHPGSYRGPAARSRFVQQLQERVAVLPGVTSVGLVGRLPLGGREWTQPYGLEGQAVQDWNANAANFRVITAGYFDAMGTRLLSGRFFDAADDRQDRRVAIVDETMAQRIAPSGSVIGRTIGFPLDGDAVWAEVVGVVENVHHESLRSRSRETLYVPYRHEASRDVSFVVRTAASPAGLIGPIRREVQALASHLPIYNVRTMTDYLSDSIGAERFAATIVGVFAVIAVVLASVGLYGVISYSVQQRTQEIGIRMALGAERTSVLRHVVAGGMALAGTGLLVGIVASVGLSRFASALLFEVRPTDITTYAGVSSVLMVVAFLACYLPARRASAVDPMVALRSE